ncbi:MAG: M3 family oligoendopeptidase [Rickettsiales bacterium]|nr:M3 family oligoendopeptidase [Rickettsiales bacterium]
MSNLFYERKIRERWWFIFMIIFLCSLLIFFVKDMSKKITGKKENKGEVKNKVVGTAVKVKNKSAEKLPTWDLSDLYSGIDDKQIKKDLDTLNKKIKKFGRDYSGKIADLSGYQMYKALIEYEGINELMGKIMSFAYLKYAENLSVEENVLFYQKMTEETTNLASNLIFFDLEINKLSDEELNRKLKENNNLKKYYGRYLSNLRLYKKHQLSLELEKLFNEKSMTSSVAWSRLFDETIDNMTFRYNGKDLNEAQIMEIINGKDAKERVKAGKIFGEKLGENIKLLAYITNTLAKDKSISDKWRGYKTPISSRNLSNLIEDDVVDNLYKSVQDNYKNISHRYYKLKAKMLKQKKLHHTDRNAPLPFDDDKVYSWNETVDVVLSSYSKFSPKMAEVGKLFFENNWIDVPTRSGKRGGAFAHPVIPTVHPYLLLNFQGKTRDVMTLAHELGHGIHMYLARPQGYFMSDTPLTLAETASVFGEQLVFRYLLDNEKDKTKKIAIIANKIEDMINTVVRQIAFLEFEKTVHDERKNGELTVDRLNEIWLTVQRKSLGDIFEFDDEYKYYWSYIPHFIHSPFYVYSYAFGDCLVNSLYMSYVQNPDGFADKYIELLSAGGSKDYKELLKAFNLNPKNKDFWQNGMNLIISLIDELESLLKE